MASDASLVAVNSPASGAASDGASDASLVKSPVADAAADAATDASVVKPSAAIADAEAGFKMKGWCVYAGCAAWRG